MYIIYWTKLKMRSITDVLLSADYINTGGIIHHKDYPPIDWCGLPRDSKLCRSCATAQITSDPHRCSKCRTKSIMPQFRVCDGKDLMSRKNCYKYILCKYIGNTSCNWCKAHVEKCNMTGASGKKQMIQKRICEYCERKLRTTSRKDANICCFCAKSHHRARVSPELPGRDDNVACMNVEPASSQDNSVVSVVSTSTDNVVESTVESVELPILDYDLDSFNWDAIDCNLLSV